LWSAATKKGLNKAALCRQLDAVGNPGKKSVSPRHGALKGATQFAAEYALSSVTNLGCSAAWFSKVASLSAETSTRTVAWIGRCRVGLWVSLRKRMSQQLVRQTQQMAEQAEAPCLYYLPGPRHHDFLWGPYHNDALCCYWQDWDDKEELARAIASKSRHPERPLAVLCCQETCGPVKLRCAQGRLRLEFAYRPGKVG